MISIESTSTVDISGEDGLSLQILISYGESDGQVWRLPDGRLAVLTLSEGIDENVENEVLNAIQSHLPAALLKSHMTDLGVDDGLAAWATAT